MSFSELTIEKRIDLLRSSGQIGDASAELARQVVDSIEKHLRVKITEKNGAMFVTHVAVAIERLLKGAEIQEGSATLLEEAKSYHEEYAFASELARGIGEKLDVVVPEAEIAYMALYIRLLASQAPPNE